MTGDISPILPALSKLLSVVLVVILVLNMSLCLSSIREIIILDTVIVSPYRGFRHIVQL